MEETLKKMTLSIEDNINLFLETGLTLRLKKLALYTMYKMTFHGEAS